MRITARAFRLAVFSCFTISGVCPAQQLQLLRQHSLSPKADSLPRIAHPNQIQSSINRDLQRLDAHAKGDATGCAGTSEDGREMFYERSVQILSRGPRSLGIAVDVSTDCGGVHPYYYQFTLAYDLETGKPIDWEKILTKADAQNAPVNPDNALPFDLPGVRSVLLQKLYRSAWKGAGQCSVDDVAPPASTEDSDLTVFLLAPASERRGLSVLPVGLASAVSACAQAVILNRNAMDELGIPADTRKTLLNDH
jgi:hypothetical protein